MKTSRMTLIEQAGNAPKSPSRQMHRSTLERRLEDGYLRIEQAMARGEDVSHWEDFWIDLLHQYEVAFHSVAEAA